VQVAPVGIFPPSNCNGELCVYNELAGFGFVPDNAVYKYGETMSIGSSIAITDWTKKDGR